MKIFCSYILVGFILVSCEKLPPETAKGKNIVACKVNDEIFRSKERKIFMGPSFGAGAWVEDALLVIRGSRYNKDDMDLRLYMQIFNFSGQGLYEYKSF